MKNPREGNVLLWDTETVFKKPFDKQINCIFEVAWSVQNIETNKEYDSKHFVVREFLEDQSMFSAWYYNENREYYMELLNKNREIVKPWEYVKKELVKSMKKSQYMTAFNSNFDQTAVGMTNSYFGIPKKMDDEMFKKLGVIPFCLMNGSVKFILEFYKEEYVEFCFNNKFITDKGNVNTNAQAIYNFFLFKQDFTNEEGGNERIRDLEIESHHAIGDVYYEFIILKQIYSQLKEKQLGIDYLLNAQKASWTKFK